MKNTKKNNETAKWKEGNERIKPRGVDKANHQMSLKDEKNDIEDNL